MLNGYFATIIKRGNNYNISTIVIAESHEKAKESLEQEFEGTEYLSISVHTKPKYENIKAGSIINLIR